MLLAKGGRVQEPKHACQDGTSQSQDKEKGKPIQLLREGEAINIAPDILHWHGASADSRFTHLAINPNVSRGGAVVWLDRVTDEEYYSERR